MLIDLAQHQSEGYIVIEVGFPDLFIIFCDKIHENVKLHFDIKLFIKYNITLLYGARGVRMSETEKTTLEMIHTAAMSEFRQKGFKSASLRNIVKTAGVTTGAFYGYYKSKEELFDALVGEQYDTLMRKFKDTQESFAGLSPEEQREGMGVQSGESMEELTDYVYENLDAFKLILCCSEGTRYENMVHEMVEIEVDATHAFVKIMEELGMPTYKVDPYPEHMLVSGLFSAFFEMIIHDVPYENAKCYVRDLKDFHTAGWRKIMGF